MFLIKDLYSKIYKSNASKLLITLFGGCLIAGLSLVISLLFDPFLNQFNHEKQINYFLFYIIFGLILVKIILNRFMMIYNMDVYFKYEKSLIDAYFSQIDKIKGESLDVRGIESWITILTNDAKQIARLTSITIPEIMVGSIGFLVALTYGLIQSSLLTFTILLMSCMSFLILKNFSKQVSRLQNDELLVNQKIQKVLLDFMVGINLFSVFGRRVFGFSYVTDYLRDWRASRFNKHQASIRLESFSMGSGFVMTAIWFSLAFYLIGIGKLRLGQYLGIAMLSDYLNWPFMVLPSLYSAYVEESVSLNRYNEYEAQVMIQGASVEEIDTFLDTDVLLEVKQLSFNRNGVNILNDINLQIMRGEKWLIKGESGSGKSTFIKILLGYYSPVEGSINWNKNEKQEKPVIGYIPQDIAIFNDTLENNILMGRSITKEEMTSVIENAGLISLVDKLPDKLQSILSTGGSNGNLSQGEIQRIGIARALVQKPDIIIADEPVSALDPLLEEQVLENLIQSTETLLLISHRSIDDQYDFKQLLIDSTSTKNKSFTSIVS